jgi:hypothetical protein
MATSGRSAGPGCDDQATREKYDAIWTALSRHRYIGPTAGLIVSVCPWRDSAAGPMADADDVRGFALALPHVVEIESDGFDFRVADKGFIWSYPERRQGTPRVIRTDIAVLFVGDEAEKQALLLGEPDLFFTTPSYDGWPLVMLRLAQVDIARLAELITDAWRMRAPDALVIDIDSADDRSGAGRG